MFDFNFYKLIEFLNLSVFVIHIAKSRETELTKVRAINIKPKDPKFDENVISVYPISFNFGLRDFYQLKGSEGKKMLSIVLISEPNKSKLESLFKNPITYLLLIGQFYISAINNNDII